MKLKNYFLKLRLRSKKLLIDLKKTHLKDLRNSFFAKIKKIPDIVHLKNLALFGSIFSIIILVLFVQRFNILRKHFIVQIPEKGGVYKHGVIGESEKINPLFLQNEAEESVSKLVFSGLTSVVDGQPEPEIAERWESPDPTTYIFYIRDNVYWHDGQKLTIEDIVFTIGLIQNPDTRTPRNNIWKGVTYETVGDKGIKFTLPNAYPGFLKVCAEPILPKHILEKVDPKNIKVAEFNQKPVGSGPYLFNRFDQLGTNNEVVLKRNENYYKDNRPYIDEVRVVFFASEKDLVSSISRRQIDGASSVSGLSDVGNIAATNFSRVYLPSYTAVFFNYKNPFLSKKEIRLAINSALNREEIIKSVGLADGAIFGPLLPGSPGFSAKQNGPVFNPEKTKEILVKEGFQLGSEGYFTKDNKVLEFRLSYIDGDYGRKIADELTKQLKLVGVKLTLSPQSPTSMMQNIIRPRNFDIILLEQNIGLDTDLYSFWHSSQINDPGQNLTGFKDRKIDKLLEQARKSQDKNYIAERNSQVQQAILDDGAAYYIHRDFSKAVFSNKLTAVLQSKVARSVDILNTIDSWYINFKEVVK